MAIAVAPQDLEPKWREGGDILTDTRGRSRPPRHLAAQSPGRGATEQKRIQPGPVYLLHRLSTRHRPSGYTPELRCVRYNIVVHFLPLISPPQPPFKVISRMTTRGAMPALLDLKRARHTHTIPTYDTRWRPLAQPRLYQVKLYRLASYQIQRPDVVVTAWKQWALRVARPRAGHARRGRRKPWGASGETRRCIWYDANRYNFTWFNRG